MKFGNAAAVLAILIAAFVMTLAANQLLSGNNNILSSVPILGSLGLSPTIPINVTTNNNEILVNKTVTKNAAGTFVQSAAITAGVPAVNSVCPTSDTIQFITDLGKLSSSTCKIGGTFHCLSAVGYVQYGTYECVKGEYIAPCNCSVSFSSATPGAATIVAQSVTNPSLYINGQTQVTVDWPATPCFGNVKTCPSFVTLTTCNAQGGCNWYGAAGCYGTNTVTCQGLDISTCSNTFGCQWTSGSCGNAPCSTWKTSSNSCTAAGCTYTTTACGGTAASCDSITDQTACSKETGCAWVGSSPILSVTTTTTAASGTTTTTTSATTTSSTTSTTTTTTTPGASSGFSASNFKCSSISGGYSCSLNYDNEIGENAIILFIVSDSQQNTISSVAYTAAQGTGTAQTNYYCTNHANYYMNWEAHRTSDGSFVSFSNPPGQLMAC